MPVSLSDWQLPGRMDLTQCEGTNERINECRATFGCEASLVGQLEGGLRAVEDSFQALSQLPSSVEGSREGKDLGVIGYSFPFH